MCDVTGEIGGTPIIPTGLNSTETAAMLLGGHPALTYEQHRGSETSSTASDLRAQIAREEWEDYKKRFRPLEDILLGYANDPNTLTDPLQEKALGRINTQYGLAPDMTRRRMESYGLQMSPEMQARNTKKLAMDKNLAEIQALNEIERFGQDQLFNVIGGSGNRSTITASTQTPQVG